MNNNASEKHSNAQKIYANIRHKLEPQQNGKIVAIDIESGDYFLGATVLEAYDQAIRKHPSATFVYLRVGHPAAYTIGAF